MTASRFSGDKSKDSGVRSLCSGFPSDVNRTDCTKGSQRFASVIAVDETRKHDRDVEQPEVLDVNQKSESSARTYPLYDNR